MVGIAGVTALTLFGPRLFGLGLRVVVDGNCPNAATVEALLQPMLPSSAELDNLSAHIEPIDEMLRVDVRSESGAILAVHDLHRSASCSALAAGAAVVIASAVASLPRAAPIVVNRPPVPPVPPAPPSQPLPPPKVLWDVNIGAVLAMTSQALTGGASIDAQLAPFTKKRGGRLGVRISAAAVGMRRLPIIVDANNGAVQGSADWTRLELGLSLRYRPWLDRPLVDLFLGPTVAAVLVQGSGFVSSYSSRAADVGLHGGLRVGRALTRISLWAELGFAGWLRPQEVALAGLAPSAHLPAWDILLSAGIGFGRFRP